MSKTYLKADKVVELFTLHKKGKNYSYIGGKLAVSPTTVRTWVRDIEAMLAGRRVDRSKGMDDLKEAVQVIKNQGIASGEYVTAAKAKMLKAIDEYVEAELRERLNRLKSMLG